jgi:putative FmdB family regulatory protein
VESLPIYEYRCTAGHHFEVVQSMSDAPVQKCQMCRSKVQRVLHAPAIHFKGTGFHNTDYGTKKRPKDGGDSNASSTSTTDTSTPSTGDSSTGGGDGATAPKVKEATPATTAARATGP